MQPYKIEFHFESFCICLSGKKIMILLLLILFLLHKHNNNKHLLHIYGIQKRSLMVYLYLLNFIKLSFKYVNMSNFMIFDLCRCHIVVQFKVIGVNIIASYDIHVNLLLLSDKYCYKIN